jgi:hypothetical protein
MFFWPYLRQPDDRAGGLGGVPVPSSDPPARKTGGDGDRWPSESSGEENCGEGADSTRLSVAGDMAAADPPSKVATGDALPASVAARATACAAVRGISDRGRALPADRGAANAAPGDASV